MSVNEIRGNGYWVIGGTSAVASKIANCVTCRELRGTVQEQKMSDLPEDRHPHLRTALSTAVVPDISRRDARK